MQAPGPVKRSQRIVPLALLLASCVATTPSKPPATGIARRSKKW